MSVGTAVAELPVAALRRFRTRDRATRCGLCAAVVDAGHRHLYDRADATLVCACAPCHLLFERGERLVAVPDRVLHDPGLPHDLWEVLQVPVGLVFVVRGDDGWIARYPGPAGVVDAPLAPAAAPALRASALFGLVEPDVEAVLVHRDASRTIAHLVPVTVGYALAATLRETWVGTDGGPAARAAVAATLADLAARSQPLRAVRP